MEDTFGEDQIGWRRGCVLIALQSAWSPSYVSVEFWVARSALRFRTEIPTDVSWSPDGSLLAVSVGSHVAVYEPDTNALCQVLTCPDCTAVSSVHFVGSSGRYLAVSGPRDVLLWDLVFQSCKLLPDSCVLPTNNPH